jgi:murein DD-endopeptidase MepM/ murein hydrolase activator NlpD
MAKLEQQQEELYDQIDALEKASEDLEAEIKRLTAASTVKYSGGTFGWPVPGYYRISSEYNPRNSPISGIAEFHQGIDIPASYGEAVVAAADGIVITSGWVSGFGNTIIIDHGSGIVTIYGHNSSLTVSNGERVTKGQQVARIGSTGYSTGNHCHFEVRINGAHTSPWNYLKK